MPPILKVLSINVDDCKDEAVPHSQYLSIYSQHVSLFPATDYLDSGSKNVTDQLHWLLFCMIEKGTNLILCPSMQLVWLCTTESIAIAIATLVS